MGRIRNAWHALLGHKDAFNDFLNADLPESKRRGDKSYMDMMKAFTSYVYACATRNATAAAKVPLRLYVMKPSRSSRMSAQTRIVPAPVLKRLQERASLRKWFAKATDPGAVEEITEHPLLTLLEQANDIEDQFSLQELTHIGLEMTGNGYWYMQKGGLGLPEQLIPLLPQYTRVLVSKAEPNVITGYVWKYGKFKAVYPEDEIVHFRYPNPLDRIYGRGRYAAAQSAADIMEGYNEYENSLLDNNARPDLLIKLTGSTNEPERNRLQRKFKKMFGGASKAGKAYVMEGEMELEPLGFPPRDMAPFQSRKLSREEIAAVFGVPLSKLTTDAVNLANAEAGNYSHLADTVEPMLLRHEQTMNVRLTPLYGDNLFLAYDDCVPENMEAKLEERAENIKDGYSSINEEREQQGRDPVPWGNEPIMSTAMAPISMSLIEPPAPVVVAPIEPPKDDDDDKRVKSIRRANEDIAFRQDYVRRMRRSLKEYFTEQERAMLRLLRKSAKAPADLQSAFTFGLNEWNARFQRDITPIYKGLALASGTRELHRLRVVGVGFDVESPELTRHFDEWSPKLADGINKDTAEKLTDAMRDGMSEGESIRDLTKRVKGVFSGKKMWESERIAQTECCRAQMFAAEQGMIQSGVVKAKIWSAAGDPCDFCADMDGKEMALGTPYHSELGKPLTVVSSATGNPISMTWEFGAVFGPPLHPNCVLPDTVVEAQDVLGAYRAWYDGEVVTLTLDDGAEITVTGNHMALTRDGFKAAKSLRLGSDIVYSPLGQRACSTETNDYGRPAPIKEIFASLNVSPGMSTVGVKATTAHLHGDGRHVNGDIEIVVPDCFLQGAIEPSVPKHLEHLTLATTDMEFFNLACAGNLTAMFVCMARAADSIVGSGRNLLSFFGGHLGKAGDIGLALRADMGTSLHQPTADDWPAYVESLRQGKLRFPSEVSANDGCSIDGFASRAGGDATASQMVIDRGAVDIVSLAKLIQRFSGLITTHRVVNIKRAQYSGHVYDLQTFSTLYTAGPVLSNCRCSLIEVMK